MSIFGTTGFDATKIEVNDNDFSPLAPGKYNVIISDASVKQTKSGTGQYLSIQFTVTGEQGRDRRVWTNLNLVNPNPVAVEIAQKDLANICTAAGIKGLLTDEQQLLGKALVIKVAVDGDRNNVKGYSAVGAITPTAPSAPTMTTTQILEPAIASSDDDMPWG